MKREIKYSERIGSFIHSIIKNNIKETEKCLINDHSFDKLKQVVIKQKRLTFKKKRKLKNSWKLCVFCK